MTSLLQKLSRYNEEVYYYMIKIDMDILMKYINKKNYILSYTELIPIMRNLSFYSRNIIQKLVF
jgi:hypothetical protein